jgi:hypothetical protein
MPGDFGAVWEGMKRVADLSRLAEEPAQFCNVTVGCNLAFWDLFHRVPDTLVTRGSVHDLSDQETLLMISFLSLLLCLPSGPSKCVTARLSVRADGYGQTPIASRCLRYIP